MKLHSPCYERDKSPYNRALLVSLILVCLFPSDYNMCKP
jgi:hypothetical protein